VRDVFGRRHLLRGDPEENTVKPFTNEDLQRLKAFRLQGYHTLTAFEQNEIVDLVDALLARLEASERCATPSTDYCALCHCEDCESNRAAWRKAAGR
jgi:hypothetical protein